MKMKHGEEECVWAIQVCTLLMRRMITDVTPLKTDSERTQLNVSIPMSSTFNTHPSESISSLNLASSSTTVGQAMAAAFAAGHSMKPVDLLKVNVIFGCQHSQFIFLT